MIGNAFFALGLACCIVIAPYEVSAQGPGDFFNRLAAGAGNTYAQEQLAGKQASAAAAEGMQVLARLMEANGYNRQRAWLVFVQSPQGQRIMRVPGALALLTDWFNAVMALPSGQGWTLDPTRAQTRQPVDTSHMRAHTRSYVRDHADTFAPDNTAQPHDQKVYNASECIGSIIMGVCHGSILPSQAYHPTCHGQMLNGECTGPVF